MNETPDFIPADENQFVIWFFGVYTKYLAKIRFRNVYIQQDYQPEKNKSTLFYGNHSSWWDALTPLILNNYRFKQNARAVMEEPQVRRYGFFKKIGCFSIDRNDPRKALKSLAYGIDWLHGENNSLYLYPEGKLGNPSVSPEQISFEQGIGWMSTRLDPDKVDIVPLTQHIHLMHDHKPTLFIHIGKPVQLTTDGKKERTLEFESILKAQMKELIRKASEKEPGFDKWL